jgi:Cu-Zn family superoxide dismutase
MKRVLLPFLFAAAGIAHADYKVDMKSIDAKGVGKSIGTVTISSAGGAGGVTLKPDLKGLPAGERGFHVHENANCGAKEKDGKPTAGEAAGPHWDPDKAAKHAGPKGGGHRGDLPTLEVAANGSATKAVTAPNIKLADLAGKSLMVHSGSDTYSEPPPNGGGAERIACGIIK